MTQREDSTRRKFGQYQVVDEIGQGGMGTVYKAWQPTLQRYVAIKVLTSHLKDPEVIERFKREASIAANLSHPNIVTIYDIAQQDGDLYIVMEYVQGRPLSDLITEEAPLPLERLVSILRQVAEALDYAHQRHFVHRDIKPSNILITSEGRAIITDFGIAKALEGSGATAQLTAAGTILGTPAYMSPEQIRGEPIDYRTDLYSLGVVCFEMLGGRPPFGGTTTAAVLYAQVNNPPPQIRDLNPSVARPVEEALDRMLAKDPEKRFPNAGAFVAALGDDKITMPVTPRPVKPERAARAAAGAPAGVSRGQPASTAQQNRSRLPLVLIGAIVLVLIVLGAVVVVLLSGEPEPPPVQTVVVISTPVPTTPAPTEPPSVGYLGLTYDLAFHSDRDGDYDIYVLDARTGELQELTDDPADDIRADWSPDGSQIVFQSDRDGERDLYLMNADGSDVRRLRSGEGENLKPVWSPDGRSILFESTRDGNPEIYRVDVQSGVTTQLTDNPAHDWAPTWSPDGRQIAFMSTRDRQGQKYEIYVMDADGGNIQRLTEGEFDNRAPSWSPDGTQIAFVSDRVDGNWDVYVMGVAGDAAGLTRLTSSPGRDWNPAWSPDGAKIAFESDREGNNELYVMDPAGLDQERLTDSPADDQRPRWAPLSR